MALLPQICAHFGILVTRRRGDKLINTYRLTLVSEGQFLAE